MGSTHGVRLCQYINGTLVLTNADFREEPYIAISHVWGPERIQKTTSRSEKWEWDTGDGETVKEAFVKERIISGIPWPVLVSPHKARFISERLQELVGETCFWMDVLCVNQNLDAERIAVVGHIPSIYRGAIRTIAIRDGDGLHECCAAATFTGTSFGGTERRALLDHIRNEHLSPSQGISESYLDRLWPLQEFLLSDNVEFVSCNARELDEPGINGDSYNLFLDFQRITNALHNLYHSWISDIMGDDVQDRDPSQVSSYAEFLLAFMRGGVVRRQKRIVFQSEISAGSSMLYHMHVNSHRVTSKPRDFVLAIMPQFDWYEPPSGIKEMSFGDLFTDCYNQASRSGHGFLPKFTKGLLDPSTSATNSFDLTPDIPQPQCLGDFLKLFGSSSHHPSNETFFTNTVTAISAYAIPDLKSTIQIVEQSMRFFTDNWALAHRTELSKHGIFPNMDPTSGSYVRYLRKNHPEMRADPRELQMYQEDLTKRLEVDSVDKEVTALLNALWGSLEIDVKGAALREDWHFYERWLLKTNPPFYKDKLLLMAAMVTCGLGLGTVGWMQQRFHPVVMAFGARGTGYLSSKSVLSADYPGQRVLGLVAKHAIGGQNPKELFPVAKSMCWCGLETFLRCFCFKPIAMYCVQRASNYGLPSGRDLYLELRYDKGSPRGGVVGFVPNFLWLNVPKGRVYQQHLDILHYNSVGNGYKSGLVSGWPIQPDNPVPAERVQSVMDLMAQYNKN